MFKRKVRKLIRNPKLFLSDMMIKRRHSIDALKPKKIEGHYKYTIVSAVYNVGRYLDEYIESVTKQHLDFEKHLHLILVDDGSTDNSAAIIKRWQRKYPNNIQYLYKENGGQASARNLGMQHVKTEWVTFADPDDILDLDYFHQVDIFAHKQKSNDIAMLCNNFIFYFDDQGVYKDTHPLKYRFKNGNAVYPVNEMGKNMQLAVNSAIFKSEVILDNSIVFDDRVKPNFEDAHFIGSYLSGIDDGHVGFISKAKYYYRKRSDGSSTLDTAWEKRGLYDDVLVYGCIDMFNQYIGKQGCVPRHVQRTVLYHLIWYFKRLVNNKQKLAFISEEEINRFKLLLDEIFSNIDVDTIMEFELAGCWFYHRVALLGLFKEADPNFQIAYIEALDQAKGMVELRYFTRSVGFEAISIAGEDIIPSFAKNVGHDFLGDSFVIERRLWIPISPEQQESNANLNIIIGDIATRISLAGKQHHNGVSYKQIASHFSAQKPKYKVDKKYQHAWLLMDRNTQADDNAEHLYRHIKHHHPEQEIYFVLEPSSNDWLRLADEGFNLLAFGSDEHESALRSCTKLISSHIDKYVSNYLGPKMLAGRHLVFLQHGVTKDNLSGWLNSKEAINCLVTTTPDEYHSFVNDGSPYKFSRKDVALTGFPRHDALLYRQSKTERLIVIMPTWRKTLVGDATQSGNDRQLNPEFMQSDFAQHWFNVLHSPILKNLAEQYNFRIAFYPHANVTPYLSLFAVPAYIEIMTNSTMPIQEVFSRAALMITDYSSVAFDMAVLDKPSIYYQFDEASFFNGGHAYTKGYFDYRQHGFGPVVTDQQTLLFELEEMLKNDGRPSHEILSRIAHTFPLRDGNSCERVYQAIIDLDKPFTNEIDENILRSYAEQASLAKKWALASSRWELYFSIVGHERASSQQHKYLHESRVENGISQVQSLRKQGRLIDAINLLSSVEQEYGVSHNNALLEQKCLIEHASRNWHAAIKGWTQLNSTSDDYQYLATLAEACLIDELSAAISYSDKSPDYHQALISIAHKEWGDVVLNLTNVLTDDLNEIPSEYIKCLLAKAYRHLAQYDEASSILASVAEDNDGHIFSELFYERLALSFANEDFNNCKKLLTGLSSYIEQLPADVINIALKTYCHLKDYKTAHSIVEKIENDSPRWLLCLSNIGNLYFLTQRWEEAEYIWEKLQASDEQANSRLLHIYFEQGKITKALKVLDVYRFSPSTLDEWLVCAELYSLVSRWDEAVRAWNHIIVHFRNSDITQRSWSNLQHAQIMKLLDSRHSQSTVM